jgi:hypothetical protein
MSSNTRLFFEPIFFTAWLFGLYSVIHTGVIPFDILAKYALLGAIGFAAWYWARLFRALVFGLSNEVIAEEQAKEDAVFHDV